MSYWNIYRQRLNRHGDTSQERLSAGREKNFEKFLNGSPHKVSFLYPDDAIEETLGVLEPYRGDESKTMMHLLTFVGTNFEAGKIIKIKNHYYMFFFWDERQDSGYNRWCLLKLNRQISWTTDSGKNISSWAYVFDQKNNMLKNELKSRSRFATVYLENLKLAFIIMPLMQEMKEGVYLEISEQNVERSFIISGFDFLSTPGVMYVSMDPVPKRDLTPIRKKEEGEDEEFFWLGTRGQQEEDDE